MNKARQFLLVSRAVQVPPLFAEVYIRPVPTTAINLLPLVEETTLSQFRSEARAVQFRPLSVDEIGRAHV